MAGSFKSIASKTITKHTAHKSYELDFPASATGATSTSFDGVDVFGYEATKPSGEYSSGSEVANGFNENDIYSATYHSFYAERPGGVTGYLSADPNGSDIVKTWKTGSNELAIFSIPHMIKGDGIKPGSVKMTNLGVTIKDDGNGNMQNASNSTHLGNVFYDYGVIVMTVASANAFIASPTKLEFKNTHVIEEHEYNCNIGKEEFNATSNHTLREHPTGSLRSFSSSSTFNPYVTSIGLYDDDYNLLAVGKLGQAIKKSEKYDTTFIIRFDT